MGLVSYDGQSKFSTTALLDTLRRDAASSLRGGGVTHTGERHLVTLGSIERRGENRRASSSGGTRARFTFSSITPTRTPFVLIEALAV
jgi:hypothetical protein